MAVKKKKEFSLLILEHSETDKYNVELILK